MTDKELLRQMLGIEDPWSITEVNFDIKARRLDVRVECRKEVWADEQGRRLHVHGYEERRWRHLNAFQFQTTISARVPRLSHPNERDDEEDGSGGRSRRGRTELLPVPWAEKNSRFTALFERFAITVLQASRSLSEGAELLGLSWDEASGIMNRAVERGMERRQLGGIRRLGIDEPERSADRLPQAARRASAASQKSFGKGQSYGSILTDPDGERVLEVQQHRDTESARTLLRTLPAEQRAEVEAIVMDMSAAFEAAAAAELPQAEVVFDRFHVSKLLHEAVDQVRKAEHRQRLAAGDDVLTGTKYFWLQAPENMSAQRLDEFIDIFTRSLVTARAWEVKEAFASFYEQPDAATAREFFRIWLRRVKARKGMVPMKRAAETIRRHLHGLLSWFAHRITNAFNEGINSLIHVIKSAARGFRSFANFRIRILFHHGKLDMAPALSPSQVPLASF